MHAQVFYLFKSHNIASVIMTDLPENLGWLVGSVTTAIATAISWLVSPEMFVALISVLIGFVSSYLLMHACNALSVYFDAFCQLRLKSH